MRGSYYSVARPVNRTPYNFNNRCISSLFFFLESDENQITIALQRIDPREWKRERERRKCNWSTLPSPPSLASTLWISEAQAIEFSGLSDMINVWLIRHLVVWCIVWCALCGAKRIGRISFGWMRWRISFWPASRIMSADRARWPEWSCLYREWPVRSTRKTRRARCTRVGNEADFSYLNLEFQTHQLHV